MTVEHFLAKYFSKLRRSWSDLWIGSTPQHWWRAGRNQASSPQPLPACCTNPLATGSNWNTFLYIAIHRPGPLPPSSFPLFKLTFQPLDVSAFWSFDTRHRAASVIFEPPFICKGFICKSFFLGVTKNKRFHLSFDPILLGLGTRIFPFQMQASLEFCFLLFHFQRIRTSIFWLGL